MRKKIVAGNWKMYKDKNGTIELISSIKLLMNESSPKREVVICPPFLSIDLAKELIKDTDIHLGAQNCYFKNEGAFTGEVSPQMLKSFGVEYVILGHSERRTYFNEYNSLINKKIKAALENGLKPIYCIGETLAEREDNKTFNVVNEQIVEGLEGITKEQMKDIVIAYEPVWAIGTGKTATPAQAEEVHQFIRELIGKIYGTETAEELTIQYGGSVKPENAADLFSQPNIDGGLIGGACLKADSFWAIVNA